MPTLQGVIVSFGNPKPALLSVMDAYQGFLQLPVTEDYSKLLGLRSDTKTYVFKRVPFGLSTSSFVFQKSMNLFNMLQKVST